MGEGSCVRFEILTAMLKRILLLWAIRLVDWYIGMKLLAAIFRLEQENASMAPYPTRLERTKVV
jgi:hypothetical protein